MVFSIKVSKFDLDKSLSCGQCFRWFKKSDYWTGVVNKFPVSAHLKNETLTIESDLNDLDFWLNYFDLNFDYECACTVLSNCGETISKAINENFGIHILNQDPWETLCSFIISQNNNIPRITNIISRLCNLFGDKPYGVSSFPRPEIISSLNIHDLSHIKAGFRAKYILDAAKCIVSSRISLDIVKSMKTNDAIKYLQTIYGVGPKVASCTLLYGYHKLDCFPIDTWMRKVLSKFFQNFDYQSFKGYQGLAQLYLFNWSRSHPEYFQ